MGRIEKCVRIQFKIPESGLKEIEALQAETGASTKTALFNNALTLFEWAVEQRKKGRIIASVDDKKNTMRELIMPALEAAKLQNNQVVKLNK